MDHTIAEYAHVLAARLWFRKTSLKDIAKHWESGEDFMRFIQGTQEYRSAVETLMRTTRSAGNCLKWIESLGDDFSELAERMGLPEKVVSEMIDRVRVWGKNGSRYTTR